MTNERHEKALEAAVRAHFGNDKYPPSEGNKRDISDAIAAYVEAMEAVILPRALGDDLLELVHPTPPRAHERPMALKGHKLAQDFRKEEHRMLVSKAPNHFTNGE